MGLSRRQRAAHLMNSARLIGTAGSVSRRLYGPAVTVLAYHRVRETPDERHYPFDMGLISATPEEFEWQMKFIRERMSPVGFEAVIEFMDEGVPLPPRPIVVTFDDGYADNYFTAFPILKKYDIPATIFLTAGFVGQDQMLWHDRAARIALTTSTGRLPGPAEPLSLAPSDRMAQRRAILADFLVHLKTLEHRELLALLDRLELENPIDNSVATASEVAILSWEHVREMRNCGISFGSHTMTHALLSRLSKEELQSELAESKQKIEHELQHPCKTIAYPVGREFAFTNDALGLVADAGYSLGTTYLPGVNYVSALDRYKFLRQNVEIDTTRPYFKALLELPELFH